MHQYISQFQNRDPDFNLLLNSDYKFPQKFAQYSIDKPLHKKVNQNFSNSNSVDHQINSFNKHSNQYDYHNILSAHENNKVDLAKNRKIQCMQISRSMNKNWETLIDMIDFYQQNANSIHKRLKCFGSLMKILNFLKLMLQRPEYQCMIQQQQSLESQQQMEFALNIIMDRYEYELRQKNYQLRQLESRIHNTQAQIDQMQMRANQILEAQLKIKRFYSDYQLKQQQIKYLENELQYYKNRQIQQQQQQNSNKLKQNFQMLLHHKKKSLQSVKQNSLQELSNENYLQNFSIYQKSNSQIKILSQYNRQNSSYSYSKDKESQYINPKNVNILYQENVISNSSSSQNTIKQYTFVQQPNHLPPKQMNLFVQKYDVSVNVDIKPCKIVHILEQIIQPVKKQIQQVKQIILIKQIKQIKQTKQICIGNERKVLNKQKILNLIIFDENSNAIRMNGIKTIMRNYKSLINLVFQLINMIWKIFIKLVKTKLTNKNQSEKLQRYLDNIYKIQQKTQTISVKFYDKYAFYKQNITFNNQQLYKEQTQPLKQICSIINKLFQELIKLI